MNTLNLSHESAYSVKVSWEFPSASGFVAKCFNKTESFVSICTINSVVFVNLSPGTEYEICVSSKENETAEKVSQTFMTCTSDAPKLDNLYESIRYEDGTYDATHFNKEVHDIFLKYFNTIVKNGDKIYASVVYNGSQKNVQTRAVIEGSVTNVSGTENLFLPFSKDVKGSQVVTLKKDLLPNSLEEEFELVETSGSTNVDLVYDPETDTFGMGGKTYGIGDRFSLFGRMVTVADGSIVLVFENTVALSYPFSATTALDVVTDLGSQFAKNVTCNVLNVVGAKTTGASGTTYSSGWIHNTDTSTTTETTRIVHTLDDNEENGTISIGVLHTDLSSNTFIEPVIQCSYDSTTISAQDASDNTTSTTINSTGLSFDSDDAAIYFGASQTFRIKFTDGTPAVLSFESYDSGSGSYVVRTEISDSS